jgi:hypothetical protein
MPRNAPKTGLGRLILIRPDNHSTGRAPVSRAAVGRVFPNAAHSRIV